MCGRTEGRRSFTDRKFTRTSWTCDVSSEGSRRLRMATRTLRWVSWHRQHQTNKVSDCWLVVRLLTDCKRHEVLIIVYLSDGSIRHSSSSPAHLHCLLMHRDVIAVVSSTSFMMLWSTSAETESWAVPLVPEQTSLMDYLYLVVFPCLKAVMHNRRHVVQLCFIRSSTHVWM